MHPLDAPGALWVLSRAGKVPRPPAGGRNLPQETDSLRKAGNGLTFLFTVSQRISPLRRRPGGFPIAPWTPSGPIPLCVGETSHKKQISCRRQETGLPFFSCIAKDFASAEATRGLSDRPLDPFGGLYSLQVGETFHKKQISCRRQSKSLSCFFTYRRSYYP